MTDSDETIDPKLNRTSNLDDVLQNLNTRATIKTLKKAATASQAVQSVSPSDSGQAALTIRHIEHGRELDEVYRLVHDAYVERGYIEPAKDGRLVHYSRLDNIPQTIVLIAEESGKVVGTNSLTLDGPNGLPSDEDFRRECDIIRAESRCLAGSWRLCTRAGYRDERRIVMELIASTVKLTVEHGVQTCVFTIHPRHANVYQKLLNMKMVVRKETTVKGLRNAPAVLMRCDYESLPQWCLE